MSIPVLKAEDSKYRLTIYQDGSPDSPRNWDNLGTMTCKHKRYRLGDEQALHTEGYSSWEEWLEFEIFENNGGEDNVLYLPLYLLDHSGIVMSTTSFKDKWDGGQVGYIWTTREEIEREGLTEEQAYKRLEGEITIYNLYLEGDVYGFELEKKKVCDCCGSVDYTYKDSCWSIYAISLKELKQLIRGCLPEGTEYLLDMLEECY